MVNSFYAWQERWAARITHRILTVSSRNTRSYLDRGIGRPEQYRTVYSGLDLARYVHANRSPEENRAVLGLPRVAGPWVGWIGRFNPQKDPFTFVQAARQLRDRIPGVQFVVCGDDPLRPSLEKATRVLAHEVGMSDSMHFLGFRRDIATVLRSVDVVMHSSIYEGMGRTVCEALACERPVAGTAVDGIVEVILSGERGGLLVPPRDPQALAAATFRLLVERDLASRLARAGRQWVERHLDVEKMVATIATVYSELLLTPGSTAPVGAPRSLEG
jgi:glycosyltransferase involved in cell wall biosynthesis